MTYRSLVTLGPCVPGDIDRATGSDWRRESSRGGALVADDVFSAVGIRRDKAVVGDGGGPAVAVGRVVLVVVAVGEPSTVARHVSLIENQGH